jgi:hypothetical protein
MRKATKRSRLDQAIAKTIKKTIKLPIDNETNTSYALDESFMAVPINPATSAENNNSIIVCNNVGEMSSNGV